MTEQELLEKIKASADEIDIPEGISPEKIKSKLDGRKKRAPGRRIAAAAAVAVLLAGLGGGAVLSHVREDVPMVAQDDEASGGADQEAAEEAAGEGAGIGETGAESKTAEAGGAAGNTKAGETEAGAAGEMAEAKAGEAGNAAAEPKKNAGALYVVAENYGDVYDLLNMRYQETGVPAIYNTADDAAITSGAAAGTDAVQELQAQSKQRGESHSSSDEAEEDSYSRTNVQTAGVDESDIVKTDGSYIYMVCDDAVKIIDVRGEAMKIAGEVSISMDSATDRVLEMYVDGDMLNLIVQKEKTDLEEKDAKKRAYYVETHVETELLTYDITNRRKPALSGSITQDGYYKTSRKMGNIVYLFTQEWMNLPDLTREEAVIGKDAGGWIPLVNGEAIAADCIYVPECGESGLIISSTDIKNPGEIVDNTMIMNDYVDIYVSSEALYLYGTDYSESGVKTQIAKFSLKDGVIQAVGATQAAGEVRDTFAINEYDGTLRLLTMDWSRGENENQLYVFDGDLKLVGELTGIAEGEQIYAARYFGDTAYFVTYRNTDPLFAVDLSDAKHPKILSELKITGFSEYLHFWGEDKLVGIGYETNPDNGAQEGVKLTMFDISDPAELKTLGTCVIDNLDYSPALYDYKCVLADAGENLLGFAGQSYDYSGSGEWQEDDSYFLFAWEDGDFKNLLTEKIGVDEDKTSNVKVSDLISNTEDLTVENAVADVLYAGEDIADYRGLYVGERFYLAGPDCVISYDREKEYQMIQKLKLQQ